MQKKPNSIASPWIDPDDAPELTEAFFDRAELWENNKFVRRVGRPKGEFTKEQVTIRLDPDVLAKLREAGPGWQTRINALLRGALELPADARVVGAVPASKAGVGLVQTPPVSLTEHPATPPAASKPARSAAKKRERV